MARRQTPTFEGLEPASPKSSDMARRSSRKKDTRCELLLRRTLWKRGIRYRLHAPDLPGRPDLVFPKQKLAVFCDGDFWHGRDLEHRLAKLAVGHNAPYWLAKIQRNSERDQQQTAALEQQGWEVLRLWETDILRDPGEQSDLVVTRLSAQPTSKLDPKLSEG